MNSREVPKLFSIREELTKVVKFLPGSPKPFYQEGFQPTIQGIVEGYSRIPEESRINYFREIKEAFLKSTGRTPSAPIIANLAIIKDGIEPLETHAMGAIKQGSPRRAIVLIDMSLGASIVSAHLVQAEDSIKHGSEKGTLELMDRANNSFPNIASGEQMQLYLKFKSGFEAAEKLLLEDRTGFSLVEEATLMMKGKSTRFKNVYTSPDEAQNVFTAYGAEFFQSLYKLAYPFAKKANDTR